MFSDQSSQIVTRSETNVEVDEFEFSKELGREQRSEEIDEIKCYIKEDCEEELTYEEMMLFWSIHKKYKRLFHMSKRYLSYIGSSTPSERLFSHASQFLSPKRLNLSPRHLEELCIVHAWLNQEGSNAFEGLNFRK